MAQPCAHTPPCIPPCAPRAPEAVKSIQRTVGEEGRVIGAVSGGVDSTVAAVLMNRAIGARFHAVLVDNGVLRKDERVQVLRRLRDDCGVNLHAIDASDLFLGKLAGVADPEAKRKIIGNTFIEVFEEEAKRIGGTVGAAIGEWIRRCFLLLTPAPACCCRSTSCSRARSTRTSSRASRSRAPRRRSSRTTTSAGC